MTCNFELLEYSIISSGDAWMLFSNSGVIYNF